MKTLEPDSYKFPSRDEQPLTTPPNVEPVDLQKLASNAVEWILSLYDVKPQVGASQSLTSVILTALQLVASSYGAQIERLNERLKVSDNLMQALRESPEPSFSIGVADKLIGQYLVELTQLRPQLTAANQKIEQLKAALAKRGVE